MAPEGSGERRLGLVQIHLAVLLAGGVGLFAKALTVGPVVLTAGRTAFGAAALLAFAALTGVSLRLASIRDLAVLLLSGCLLAGHWLAFFQSIRASTVAVGLLAFSAFPVFTTFLEPLFFGERLRGRDVATAVGVSLGLALVAPGFDPADETTRGLLWGGLSALLYAFLYLANRASHARHPTGAISFYQQLGAALCTVPFAFQGTRPPTARDWAGLVVLGVVFTAIGQGLVVAGLRRVRAQTASVIFGLEAIYGIALAWLLLGESPPVRTLLGGGLICGSVLSASLARERPGPRASGTTETSA